MSEKDFENFLKENPNRKYDPKTGKVTLNKNEKNKKEQKKKTSVEIPEPTFVIPEKNAKKQNKYRNTKVYEYEDGTVSQYKLEEKGKPVETFDSVKEYKRWEELKLLEKAGEITGLQRQCNITIEEAFVYQGKKIQAIKYKADHLYIRDDTIVVEDVKPFDKKTQKFRTTPDFKLKWKLLKKRYPHYSFELY